MGRREYFCYSAVLAAWGDLQQKGRKTDVVSAFPRDNPKHQFSHRGRCYDADLGSLLFMLTMLPAW